jgi:hypothetical protein
MHPASPGNSPAALPPALKSTLDFNAWTRTNARTGLDFDASLTNLRTAVDDLAAALRDATPDAIRFADGGAFDPLCWSAGEVGPILELMAARPDGVDKLAAARLAFARDSVKVLTRLGREAAVDLDAVAVGRQVFEAFGRDVGPSVAEVNAAAAGEAWGSPPDRWASLYRVAVNDGGPEEGGWTWTSRELVASVQIDEADADAWLETACDGLAALPAAARLTLTAALDAHGLTLPGSTPTPDGGTRPLRSPSSARPEVDAEVFLEPYPGANAALTRPQYE